MCKSFTYYIYFLNLSIYILTIIYHFDTQISTISHFKIFYNQFFIHPSFVKMAISMVPEQHLGLWFMTLIMTRDATSSEF